jgi:hypothetical protein
VAAKDKNIYSEVGASWVWGIKRTYVLGRCELERTYVREAFYSSKVINWSFKIACLISAGTFSPSFDKI